MTTQLSPLPVQRFFDNNNNPLSGGQLWTYQAGTSTPQATYTDSTGSTPNANPVILNARGEGNVWLTPGQAYKFVLKDASANIIWTTDQILSSATSDLLVNLASITDSTKGSSLVGYLPPWSGAVGRTVSQRLQDYISAADFGLATANTGAQNNTAIAAAISYAISQGGATIHIPRGTYNFASTINLNGASNVRLTGDGIDATILQITSATVDFLLCTTSVVYMTIDNMTLTSSVTRTAGSMFSTTGFWRRGLIYRVKVQNHFNGLNIASYEACCISETNIVSPTGTGTAIIVATAAASSQGANLTIIDCFLRGNNDLTQGTPVGLVGIQIYDGDAVFVVNTDISAFTNQCMVIAPQTSSSNNYFVQSFFDATSVGDNVLINGTGAKNRYQFTGCWFSFAGKVAGFNTADRMGINIPANGTYSDWNFTGCRFVQQTGAGVFIAAPDADFTFSGCNFNGCGTNTSTYTASIYYNQLVTQTQPTLISGCKFIPGAGNTADIIYSTTNSVGNVITGCQMGKGISYPAGATFGNVTGNADPNTTDTIASAATLQVSPTKNFYTITGTTNVGGLFRTFTGHTVTFVATGVFTWTNGGALALAGGANFTTAAGSTITLMCQPTGSVWREVSRHT